MSRQEDGVGETQGHHRFGRMLVEQPLQVVERGKLGYSRSGGVVLPVVLRRTVSLCRRFRADAGWSTANPASDAAPPASTTSRRGPTIESGNPVAQAAMAAPLERVVA